MKSVVFHLIPFNKKTLFLWMAKRRARAREGEKEVYGEKRKPLIKLTRLTGG
jgi:uncharacterized membrane protein